MTDSNISNRVAQFLSDQDPQMAGCEITDYMTVPGGISRITAGFEVHHENGSEKLVLRADPPAGTAIIETDRATEWSLLRYLNVETSIPVPRARYFDADGSQLGSPAIISEFIEGPSLTSVARAGTEERRRELSVLVVELAACVANTSIEGLPPQLGRPNSWDEYMDTQIAQWAETERLSNGSDPYMRYVGAWLDANRPAPAPLMLVHGDFQTPNILMPAEDEVSLIDWELTHIGDPREDLGWFRLVSMLTPPDVMGPDGEAFCARYRELTGLTAQVINPAVISYFTVMSSLRVFAGILGGATAMDEGQASSTAIAYTALIQSSVHRVWENIITGLGTKMDSGA